MALGAETTTVPPGFRFRPTDQELLDYLSKKGASESIHPDVIQEIDINRLEPSDIKDLCSVWTGQDEWYFFRHSTAGTRRTTARYWRTALGQWMAQGRDKRIKVGSGTTIGLRKRMVYYKRGKKTGWIMDHIVAPAPTDHGWAVCRVFHRCRSFPSTHPAVTNNSSPVSGFLDKLMSPFKAVKSVQLNLNLAIFGPFGLKIEFALQ